ncbi:Acyl-CoA dehydrogenase, C-terminal domain protein [Brevundimonas sp. BAL3]|nr:Acyl-CoA dehydrogenase, C-terminal domain protein [Brevundimonas sp. BAL3]
MLQESLDQLLGAADGVATAAMEAGGLPHGLWDEIEASGFSRAFELGAESIAWTDAYPIFEATGRHATPAPLAETAFAGWLLAQAGIAQPEGVLSFARCDAIDSEVFDVDISDVPWGRAAAHVVLVSPGPEGQVALIETARLGWVLDVNMALEPRDSLKAKAMTVIARGAHGHTVDLVQVGGALVRSAQIAGALKRCLELTVQYSNERVQFGRSIGKFQAIQQQIAHFASLSLMAGNAAECAFADAGGLNSQLTAVAKISAGDAGDVGAAVAHAVHGAMGFTKEYMLHFSTRRIWAWRGEYGSSAWWAERLGAAMCAAGEDGLWPAIVTGHATPFLTNPMMRNRA